MKDKVSTTERYHTFVLLMLAGGFMGSYSYYLKGGVFANAETANLLILSLNAASADWSGCARVLVPILTFLFGSFLSEVMIDRLKKAWPPLLITCEIILLSLLSLLPESTPQTIYHVSIALISSMQFNTFRQARGVALSTLFCTAHLRGFGAGLYHAMKDWDREVLRRALYHIGLILTFVLGAFCCARASRLFGTRTLVLAVIPLVPVLIEILRTSGRCK